MVDLSMLEGAAFQESPTGQSMLIALVWMDKTNINRAEIVMTAMKVLRSRG